MIAMEIAIVETNAMIRLPVPADSPPIRPKNIKVKSFESLSGVRNRIIESAPAKAKARATLSPMAIITSVLIVVRKTSENTNDLAYVEPVNVTRYVRTQLSIQ